jgi:hypothetical protein
MVARSSWLKGALAGEGELGHTLQPGQSTVDGSAESRHRLMRMGLNGIYGSFRYGATFQSAGDAVYGQRDQAAREVWGEWGAGIMKVRSTVTQRWDNINGDPTRARNTLLEQRTALSLAPTPQLPTVTLVYARGSSATSAEPLGMAPSRNLNDMVEAALSVKRPQWDARLFSNYTLVTDRIGDADSRGTTHGIQGTYRPSDELTIAPSLSLREDQQRMSGVQIETPTASLSLTYAPRKSFNWTAFGLYSHAQSSDRLINSNTYKVKSVFTWSALDRAGLNTTISLDAGYSASIDESPTGHSTEDLSGLVRVQLVGF